MAKTLVMAKHGNERLQNGAEGCHTRWANDGLCSGVIMARWLNELGDDDEKFMSLKNTTNGEVRRNWLRSNDHIVAMDPEISRLRGKAEEARRENSRARRALASAERARQQALTS